MIRSDEFGYSEELFEFVLQEPSINKLKPSSMQTLDLEPLGIYEIPRGREILHNAELFTSIGTIGSARFESLRQILRMYGELNALKAARSEPKSIQRT